MEDSTHVGKVTAKQFLSSTRTKDELTGLPLGLIRCLDQVLRSASISPNVPRFLLRPTCVMFCTGFLPPNAFCIGFQHLSGDLRRVLPNAPSYLTDLCRPVSDFEIGRASC